MIGLWRRPRTSDLKSEISNLRLLNVRSSRIAANQAISKQITPNQSRTKRGIWRGTECAGGGARAVARPGLEIWRLDILWALVIAHWSFPHGCHGSVTSQSRVAPQKRSVFIDLSRCHGSAWGARRAEDPNTKYQAPEKLQAPSWLPAPRSRLLAMLGFVKLCVRIDT
jgi:hypothetical protein